MEVLNRFTHPLKQVPSIRPSLSFQTHGRISINEAGVKLLGLAAGEAVSLVILEEKLYVGKHSDGYMLNAASRRKSLEFQCLSLCRHIFEKMEYKGTHAACVIKPEKIKKKPFPGDLFELEFPKNVE
jgi:hypothetical protein